MLAAVIFAAIVVVELVPQSGSYAAAAERTGSQPRPTSSPGLKAQIVKPPMLKGAGFSPPSRVLAPVVGSMARLPSSSLAREGATPASKILHLAVTLRLPDPGSVQSYIAATADRSSPEFHHYLTPAEFGRLFGPSKAQVNTVVAALQSLGLHPGPVSADRLTIPVTASVRAAERAFGTPFENFRLPTGRVAFANTSVPKLPVNVIGIVQGVIGMTDLVRAHPVGLVRAQPPVGHGVPGERASDAPAPGAGSLMATGPGPQACSQASQTASAYGSYTAGELASAYGFAPLYALGDLGQGVTVALVELEPNSPSDIATYQSCYGTNTTVNYISVDGGAGSGPGSGEAALDIEDVIGLAPEATIDVYQAPSSDQYYAFSSIINSDTAQVISTSWGLCEPEAPPSYLQSEQALFEQAAAQGETVLAAAGDSGSEDCYSAAADPNATELAVDDPASQPYVVGVGGTSLTAPPYSNAPSQSEWDNSYGAGGGGISQVWAMPAYQSQYSVPGVVNAYSSNAPCGATSGYCREVPDVSASANPVHGYVIYFTGGKTPGWQVVGGTSGAAPLWAALSALVDASPYCASYGSGNPGATPQGLYQIASSSTYYGLAFSDITQGDNDFTGTNGGLYPATAGYNMDGGLGAPIASHADNFIPGIAADMCYQYATRDYKASISSVSPTKGPSGQTTTVTIQGSGFLPIPGADRLEVGSTSDPNVTCQSSTTCTAVLPAATSAGTVDLRMYVADLSVSPVVAADEFTYTPSSTALSDVTGPDPAPASAGVVSNYALTFTTSANGALQAFSGTVSLSAPAGTVFPSSAGSYELGSVPAPSVTGGGTSEVVVTVPTSVGASTQVSMLIKGVVNPPGGTYTMSVATSADAQPVETPSYLVTSSHIGYSPITPTRILDTRPGSGYPGAGEGLGPGSTMSVQVSGSVVPSAATAVVLNVTVTSTTATSYLTVWPAGQSMPTASSLNWSPGQTVANLVTVGLGSGGEVDAYNAAGQAELVVDVEGYYVQNAVPGEGLYNPLPSPQRVCDTRQGNPSGLSGERLSQCEGKLPAPGTSLQVQLAGLGGIPQAGVSAVVLNLTAVDPSGSGYLTAYPAGQPVPTASNVNFTAGQTVANRVIVAVSSAGAVDIYSSAGSPNILVDVSGWYTNGSSSSATGYQFTPEPAPVRICDTRTSQPSNQCTGRALSAGSTLGIRVVGVGGVPSYAAAVVANVTVTDTTAGSYLTLFPAGGNLPVVSDLNWASGSTVANMAIMTVGNSGDIVAFNQAGIADLIVDVTGWFS